MDDGNGLIEQYGGMQTGIMGNQITQEDMKTMQNSIQKAHGMMYEVGVDGQYVSTMLVLDKIPVSILKRAHVTHYLVLDGDGLITHRSVTNTLEDTGTLIKLRGNA